MEKSANFSLVNQTGYDIPEGKTYTPVEYIWIGGTGQDLRSKTKMYQKKITKLEDLEEWNYDGSSTYQATTEASEIILKPVAMFKDPFRKPCGLLALCETYMPDGKPAPANFRAVAKKVMDAAAGEKPQFGIEQEYTIFVSKGTTHKNPLGWPEGGFPGVQGPYYCSVGSGNSYGRELVELHMRACMAAGLNYAGLNAEVLPAQWEFQIGICDGIQMGDHLWVARYLLARCAEHFGWDVSFDPKPIPGEWNGSGGHTNYSTEKMRAKGGFKEIEAAMPKLEAKHKDHIECYGEGNQRRLIGACETSSIDTFSYGVGHRGASIRIPTYSVKNDGGYLEDRRPAASLDPYVVTAMLVDTTCLESKFLPEIKGAYQDFQTKRQKKVAHH
jgi:glutamine synthetase